MKLSKFREKSNEYTAKASEITRQLSLAGIGIIWLFKNGTAEQSLIDKFLVIPLLFLAFALLVDLLQYIIAGQTWINFFREQEQQLDGSNEDPEIKAPTHLNRVIYTCYYIKVVSMVFSYFFIIAFLLSKV